MQFQTVLATKKRISSLTQIKDHLGNPIRSTLPERYKRLQLSYEMCVCVCIFSAFYRFPVSSIFPFISSASDCSFDVAKREYLNECMFGMVLNLVRSLFFWLVRDFSPRTNHSRPVPSLAHFINRLTRSDEHTTYVRTVRTYFTVTPFCFEIFHIQLKTHPAQRWICP